MVVVPVLTAPRCGSSAVAGSLHKMGVFMGRQFQKVDELNQRGYWEDSQWKTITTIAQYVFGGTDIEPDLGAAVEFIDPGLRNFA